MKPSSVSSRRPRSTAAQRAQWAQRFFQSGLSQREFAHHQGLRLLTLQRWVTQYSARTSLRACATAPTFAELKLPVVAPPPRWGAELLRPDGTTLRLAHDVSATLVRHLLRAW